MKIDQTVRSRNSYTFEITVIVFFFSIFKVRTKIGRKKILQRNPLSSMCILKAFGNSQSVIRLFIVMWRQEATALG